MTVTSYSNVESREATPTSDFLAKRTNTVTLNKESEPCCLYPDSGNIHQIVAAE
jgi:hypothetical protein